MPTLAKIPNEYISVAKEVIAAYADCTLEWDKAQHVLNLRFKASQPVPSPVAVEIMRIAVPNGYNEFEADLLGRIDGDITIAREGSVCVYVAHDAVIGDMKADETDEQEDGTTRLWWD